MPATATSFDDYRAAVVTAIRANGFACSRALELTRDNLDLVYLNFGLRPAVDVGRAIVRLVELDRDADAMAALDPTTELHAPEQGETSTGRESDGADGEV